MNEDANTDQMSTKQDRAVQRAALLATFSVQLRQARRARKMRQEELAKKAGLPKTSISHYENNYESKAGQRAPSFDSLARLADALNVSADFLLGRTNHMNVDCGF